MYSQYSRSVTGAALLASLAAFLFASALPAQTSFGRISGSVTDASGAAIAEAQIAAINTETQLTRTAKSNDQGFYVITDLPIGPYSVTASQTGFQKSEQKGLNMVADGRVTADFKLSVGDMTQTIEVTAASSEQINTVSGELAKTIDRKEIENLALNGGNYIELLTLVPGAVVTNPDQFSVTTTLTATNQNINGNRGDSQNLTVDGAFNLVAGSNGSLINNVNSNFIQEVKIQTSNFSSEYGRTAGAAFNIVTKNGTNQFHGSVFELFRNDTLDARNFYSPSKTKLRYNDFGAAVGGPIRKDKLFFFAGQEWKRLRQNASPTRQTVPSTAWLNGDFSSLAAGTTIKFPGTTTPIPGNFIPSSMITADGAAFANVYKLMEKRAASFTDAQVAQNLILQPENPLDFRQTLVRLDYRLNEKHNVYGRWISDSNSLIDPYGTFSGSNLPTTPTLRKRPGQSYLMAHTWLPTPTMINELRANASWASQNIPPSGDAWQRSAYGFQYPQIYSGGNYDNGIPDTTLSGYANFKGPNFALHSPSTDIQFADNFSWVKSPHLLKFGFSAVRDRVDQNGRPSYTGNVTFNASGNTNSTGNAVADMLLGNFRTYSEANSDPTGFFRFWQPGMFVQDSWKISRRLSLELGIRAEWMQPMYTDANNMVNFDPALYNPAQAVRINSAGNLVAGVGNPYNGLIRVGSGIPESEQGRVPGSTGPLFQQIGAGAPRGLYDAQWVVAPRFGFAYSVTPRTAVRGGYGIFYSRPQGNLVFSQVNIPPVLQTIQYENGNIANPTGGSGLLAPLANISAIDPNLKNGYSEQYSFSIQREIVRGTTAEIAYVGNLGRHLLRQPDVNQLPFLANAANQALPTAQRAPSASLRPYLGYNSILQYRSDSTSNYHALQTYIAKRAGKLFMTASYTWAKSLGDSSGQGDNPENYFDRHYAYGPTSFDRRHVFIGTYVWTMPGLAGHNTGLRLIAGGWMMSGTIRLQTGQFYTVQANTSIGNRRADYLGGSVYPETQDNNNWLLKTAFAAAPELRRGNAGVGTARGPGLQSYNLSMSKNVSIHERYGLKFQADLFNAVNLANFSGLNVTQTDANYGRLSSAYAPRNVQLSLKLNF